MAKMTPDEPGAPGDLVLLMSTFPNLEDLGEIAATLVGENLCACVNILRESLSIYRWNGEIVTNKEVLCLIKTSRGRQAALVARLTELHPYEVPEIITLPTSSVNEPYLRWVGEMTQPPSPAATTTEPDETA
jgi:periplasmic divalent cation tolerance protein